MMTTMSQVRVPPLSAYVRFLSPLLDPTAANELATKRAAEALGVGSGGEFEALAKEITVVASLLASRAKTMRSKVEYEREQIRQRVQQQQAAVESKLAEARGPKGKLAKEADEQLSLAVASASRIKCVGFGRTKSWHRTSPGPANTTRASNGGGSGGVESGRRS